VSGPILAFESVDAGYGPFRALFGVSFEVPAGQAVALVGPNGSGKSTVARAASGLITPSAGRVLVDG
jgi:branched-chain amino acid transport system ATP-binding protein